MHARGLALTMFLSVLPPLCASGLAFAIESETMRTGSRRWFHFTDGANPLLSISYSEQTASTSTLSWRFVAASGGVDEEHLVRAICTTFDHLLSTGSLERGLSVRLDPSVLTDGSRKDFDHSIRRLMRELDTREMAGGYNGTVAALIRRAYRDTSFVQSLRAHFIERGYASSLACADEHPRLAEPSFMRWSEVAARPEPFHSSTALSCSLVVFPDTPMPVGTREDSSNTTERQRTFGRVAVQYLAPTNALSFLPRHMSSTGGIMAGNMSQPYDRTMTTGNALWKETSGITVVETPDYATSLELTCVSGDGQVVCGTFVPRTMTVIHEGIVSLSSRGVEQISVSRDVRDSSVSAMSFHGGTLVGACMNPEVHGGPRPYSWSADAGLCVLPPFSRGDDLAVTGRATGVSSNGLTVVGNMLDSDHVSYAFVWTPIDGTERIELLPEASGGFATGVSLDGSTVVGYCKYRHGDVHALPFVWTRKSGVQRVPMPTDIESSISNAISGDGRTVIGQMLLPNGHKEAFVWTKAAGTWCIKELVPEKDRRVFVFDDATCLSADGRIIAGVGCNEELRIRAWRIELK